jgi:putative heme-binding domain-containing protein
MPVPLFRPAALWTVLVALAASWPITLPSIAADDSRTQVMLEALSRLKGQDLEASPALKNAVLNVLKQVDGKPAAVEIIRDFQLKDQAPALLDFALKNPTNALASDALKTLLSFERSDLLQLPLADDSQAALLIEPLGDTGENRIAPLLLPLVTDAKRDVALRRGAVKSLARVHDGAAGLLALAKDDKLPADVKLVTATELSGVRWANLKAEAAQVLPPPAAKGDHALPPTAELLKLAGDAAKGAAIFRRPDINCIGCHKVGAEGTDFGPALTEIGTKLGKDALIESILDPSAGIGFGYEAWQFELKNGDEAFGLIGSETENEVELKVQGTTPHRLKKSDIAKREQQKLSIMPAGLQAALTTQEFVDLIAYLASLKKP